MAKWPQSDVFKHHQAVRADDIEARLLAGYDGAFRERAREEGVNPEEPTVGGFMLS